MLLPTRHSFLIARSTILCALVGRPDKLAGVERTIRIFRSFAEADQAEVDFYHSLTPQQRLEILFELVASAHPDEIEQRSERVCRIIKLQED